MRSKDREKGILLPLFSFPSSDGLGDLGKSAYRFADFLKACGQDCLQILPLCPIDGYNSPYKTKSSFAGEILYINLELLCRDGYLKPHELPVFENGQKVDYETLRDIKIPLLYTAAARFDKENPEYKSFLKNNRFWINNYALFCAAGESIEKMESGIKYRETGAIINLLTEKKREIDFFKITQFFFFKQFYAFKHYLSKLNIKLIGDLPFYVGTDSADVWSAPNNFLLNRDYSPRLVAGVPPDKFSQTGQLWECPVYDFYYQKSDNFSWWKSRFSHSFSMYDTVRIDHFRAFAEYYCIEPTEKTAQNGEFKAGVGEEFFYTLSPVFKNRGVIAEDLGGEKDAAVGRLIKKLGIPNMKVLQFAFSGKKDNPFLPENYGENCVAYTGTHDNNTARGWYETEATKAEKAVFRAILGSGNVSENMIYSVMKSKAGLAVIPLYDYMDKDAHYRINTPGKKTGNWQTRISESDLTDTLIDKIKELSNRK